MEGEREDSSKLELSLWAKEFLVNIVDCVKIVYSFPTDEEFRAIGNLYRPY